MIGGNEIRGSLKGRRRMNTAANKKLDSSNSLADSAIRIGTHLRRQPRQEDACGP